MAFETVGCFYPLHLFFFYILYYNVEYNEGDKINCCIMEVREDGTATVSLSPDLLEAANKLKKKKKKSSTKDSSVFSKHRKLQLTEVRWLYCKGYHDSTRITATVR